MEIERTSSIQRVVEDTLRRLVADPLTRDKAIDAIEQAVEQEDSPEWRKLRVLAWLNREDLLPSIHCLEEDGFRFEDLASDSPEAHRKAADVQRILRAFGFELGRDGVDGYFGGPPGEPVALDLEECATLIARGSSREKLLGHRSEGATESWTRDATRRLQTFLGRFGLPADRTDLRQACLVRPDGLFGARTLAGLSAFLQEREPPALGARPY